MEHSTNKTMSWRSPSNIALVKYWGKRGNQLPMNPSISFTLNNSYTETTVTLSAGVNTGTVSLSLLFEGRPNTNFEKRLTHFVNSITDYMPFLKGSHLSVVSKNSFPHSSGIASSASAMSALALCLVSLESEITGNLHSINSFNQKASVIARLGSGSAARSISGRINLWGKLNVIPDSSDEFALNITKHSHNIFKNYGDAILIVTDQSKKVSSTLGHSLMKNHPFANNKFEEGLRNSERLLQILKSGAQDDFAVLVEWEALALHAMMMTSHPSFILMEPNTLEILQKIRSFRFDTKIPICFTLDAGANVHLLYPNENKIAVHDFVNQSLTDYCINKRWIDDNVGEGSIMLTDDL